MAFPNFSAFDLVFMIGPVFWALAILSGAFLFWRSGRRELIEAELLLDIMVVSSVGALILARIVDFIARPEIYQWSILRLVFFNEYPGFDPWGALLGFYLASFLYLRVRKESFWQVLDLAAAPVAFSIFLVFLSYYLASLANNFWINPSLYEVFAYFVVFWLLARFGKKRRHAGFFVCLFVVLVSLVALAKYYVERGRSLELTLSFLFGLVATACWYILAKRKVFTDLKSLFALTLLVIFRLKRALSDISEADNLAKSIVLSPYLFSKLVWYFVKWIGHEIVLGFSDLIGAFGLRR